MTAAKPEAADPRFRRILALDDFEPAARRKLPRPLFGYIQGGAETGVSTAANRTQFDAFAFVTRSLRNVSTISLQTPLFGAVYDAPFGMAPMGCTALNAYRGDVQLTKAAKAANIPMMLSGAALVPMEEVVAANPDAWFQAYLNGQEDEILTTLARVTAAGFKTLVVTVDVQVRGNREGEIRAGFTSPLRPSPRLAWDGLVRPDWLVNVFAKTLVRHGMPRFEHMSPKHRIPVISSSAVREFSRQGQMTWDHIRLIRDTWRGALVVKGLLSAQDAALAQQCGCDGIVVSNHGGRQLDGAIAALFLLPEIVAASKGMLVMVDGGFRRGSDIIKALALGADFVFMGRPFGYANAVGGEAGAAHAIGLLKKELRSDMAMLGCTAIGQIGPDCLRKADGAPVGARA